MEVGELVQDMQVMVKRMFLVVYYEGDFKSSEHISLPDAFYVKAFAAR